MIERMIRRLHHYGDPPDARLREDVDGDVADVLDRVDLLVESARARHIREAVERLDESTVWRLISALEIVDDSSHARDALLAALTKGQA